jgi:hypothetical protein
MRLALLLPLLLLAACAHVERAGDVNVEAGAVSAERTFAATPEAVASVLLGMFPEARRTETDEGDALFVVPRQETGTTYGWQIAPRIEAHVRPTAEGTRVLVRVADTPKVAYAGNDLATQMNYDTVDLQHTDVARSQRYARVLIERIEARLARQTAAR